MIKIETSDIQTVPAYVIEDEDTTTSDRASLYDRNKVNNIEQSLPRNEYPTNVEETKLLSDARNENLSPIELEPLETFILKLKKAIKKSHQFQTSHLTSSDDTNRRTQSKEIRSKKSLKILARERRIAKQRVRSEAVEAVLKYGMRPVDAIRRFGVPHRTLHRHLRKARESESKK